MALCQELLLELNTDCLEFCQLQDSTWRLAVGTYQLDEATGIRHGRLHMFSVQQGPTLHLDSTLDVPGIFDLHWWNPDTSSQQPKVSLALADGTLQLVELSAAEVPASTSSNSPSSHPLTPTAACQAISEGMALYVDWGNTTTPSSSSSSSKSTAALSGSGGHVSTVQVVEGRLQQTHEWPAHDLEAWVVTFDQHQVRGRPCGVRVIGLISVCCHLMPLSCLCVATHQPAAIAASAWSMLQLAPA
jgi:hypothetical protein